MYSVRYSCSNCGHDFSQEFPKGQKANPKVVCPNCECLTGERIWDKPDEITREPKFLPSPYYCPWPYGHPPEYLKPYIPPPTIWEWPNYGYKTTCATDIDETGPGGILDNILQKYSGAWKKLAEM